jgi:hypothetical protein
VTGGTSGTGVLLGTRRAAAGRRWAAAGRRSVAKSRIASLQSWLRVAGEVPEAGEIVVNIHK